MLKYRKYTSIQQRTSSRPFLSPITHPRSPEKSRVKPTMGQIWSKKTQQLVENELEGYYILITFAPEKITTKKPKQKNKE